MQRYRMIAGLVSVTAATAVIAGCSGGGGESGGQGSSGGAPSSSSSSSASSSSSNAASAEQDAINQLLKSNPIKFEVNKSDLNQQSEDTLKKVAEGLTKSPDTKVKVTGFVYPKSIPADKEKTLSNERAEAVAKALEKDGLDKSRVSTEAGGPSENGASAKIDVSK